MYEKPSLLAIFQQSLAEQWPDLKTFYALKAIGVQFYELQFVPYEIVCCDERHHFISLTLETQCSIGQHFHVCRVKEVIRLHRLGALNYQHFIQALCSAGVAASIAHIQRNTITYRSLDNSTYTESVPQYPSVVRDLAPPPSLLAAD